jgi:hypothetical protein
MSAPNTRKAPKIHDSQERIFRNCVIEGLHPAIRQCVRLFFGS